MRAFVLNLNGKKLCTAGVGDEGVLSAIVSWVRRKGERTLAKRPGSVEEEMGVSLGGLISGTGDHLRWRQRRIGVGDEICVKVIETTSVDTPRHRQRRDRTEALRHQKTYVRRMAKKFGWKISRTR